MTQKTLYTILQGLVCLGRYAPANPLVVVGNFLSPISLLKNLENY